MSGAISTDVPALRAGLVVMERLTFCDADAATPVESLHAVAATAASVATTKVRALEGSTIEIP
jgi:hypothetical protein